MQGFDLTFRFSGFFLPTKIKKTLEDMRNIKKAEGKNRLSTLCVG
jgi:hypothetical protein